MYRAPLISRIKFGVLGIVFCLATAAAAFACSCREKQPVCAAYGDAKAVFVGKVVDGERGERMSDMFKAGTKDQTFKFAVSRAVLGVQAGEAVDVHTGFGFGDCGFPFEKGEEYIVYAYEHEGQLTTSVCTRTALISSGVGDLSELQQVLQNSGATVSGAVTRYEQSSLLGEPRLPYANRVIRLIRSGDSKIFETRTDATGKYIFAKLPEGLYLLDNKLETGWSFDFYHEKEFRLNAHGCAIKNLSIENDMRAKVTVLDPDGRPVTNRWVEFVPVGIAWSTNSLPDEFGVTNPQGQLYTFDIPPGRYTVSVNFFHAPEKAAPFPAVFAPGVLDRTAAQVIEIKPGSQIPDLYIRIPRRLEAAAVSGTVFWPDGTPAAGVSVGLTDVVANNICVSGCVQTDANGKFQVDGYAGREYKVWVRGSKGVDENEIVFRVETKTFTVTRDLAPFRVTLRRTTQ
ncbi:MAG TPA: hypothetical protein VFZ23_14270 [Pyrinomonadaceae bacterium]